ncbi:MAG: DNA/RNA nuclease SfsA [Magnetococcales bacterium]|nr:DNA/RNA nuclease SfsA [Magnetococcales bacterium]
MFFTPPLIQGTLIRRYKRFLADIELENGQVVVAHCANTGSMTGLAEPGMQVRLSIANNPKRKLGYTWEMSFANSTWVGINTGLTNRLVSEALEAKIIPQLTKYVNIRREVAFGKETRLDFLLTDNNDSRCYVEVKSVTLQRCDHLAFPDAVTKRGTRHLQALMDVVACGDRAVLFFLAQRSDGAYFKPAGDIDPTYAKKLKEAIQSGVEVMAWQCRVEKDNITVNSQLSMELM